MNEKRLRGLTWIGGTLTISALALQTAAQAGSPEGTARFVGPVESRVWVGLGYLSEDNYHFGRYTGPVEEGVYPDLHLDLRYQGEGDDDARYGRLEGRDLGLDSRRIRGRYGVQGTYGVHLEYDETPRFHDEEVETPFRSDGRDRLRLPEGGSTAEVEDWTREWDIDTERRELSVGGQRHLGEDWKVNASFSRQEKEGRQYRGYGRWLNKAAFQMPAPVDHRTDQVDVGAEYADDALQARFGYHLSAFSQMEGDHFTVQDPHPVDDPDRQAEWDDETEERTLSMPPDNTYHQISGSAGYTIQPGSRVSADLVLGRSEQDEDFIDDPDYQDELQDLPGSLDGQIDTTRVGLRGMHRFHPRLQVRGGYRYEDRDNDTPRQWVQGTSTRVHGWTRQTVDLDGDIRLPARTNLLVGYEYEETDRELADDETQDHMVHTRVRSRVTDDLEGSVYARYLDRYGANYAGPVEQDRFGFGDETRRMRMYHLADLDRVEVGGTGTYSITPELALGVELTYAQDDYDASEVGLLKDERWSYTATVDYFPTERLTTYGFVTLEDTARDQGGFERALDQDEVTWTVGLGGEATVTEDARTSVGAEVLFLDSETDINVSDQAGDDQSYPTLAIEKVRLELYGERELTDQLDARLAYVGQSYSEDDWALGYGPESGELNDDDMMFMGRDAYDYTAHMVVGSLGYRF